jgi:putative ABC transport system permease protein
MSRVRLVEAAPRAVVAAEPVQVAGVRGWRAMARVGLRMLLHDRLKLFGTLVGVVFSVVLSNQQAATLVGLLAKNTMLARRSGADVWIAPPSTELLQPGATMPDSVLSAARTTPGVAWAQPIIMAGGSVKLPSGGTEGVTVIGTELPALRGGPWNVVAGDPRDLALPDAMFFEDSDREKLGGLNLGSVRELNNHRVQVVGFTVGLIPFGPSYSFASFDTARELGHVPNHEESYVLIGLEKGASADLVVRTLRDRLPDQRVMTRAEAEARTVRYILTATSIGITIGTGAAFAVIVGFVIVALTMFSSVVDHLREFGTLKAIGATNGDLARLLIVQAVFCAVVGWGIGEALVALLVRGISGPQLPLTLPPWLIALTFGGILLLCIFASTLALVRLRKVEPAMVFRG